MTITEINIKSFGCLHDVIIHPIDGVNIISGNNESGKSTLASFISFIFFGINAKDKKDGVNPKDRYISWQTGTASGSITLKTKDGRVYRIEREAFENKRLTDTVRIFDVENGTVIKGEKPNAMFLDGISQTAYRKICHFAQGSDGNFSGDEIKKALENMISSADWETDSEKALARLDKERTKLLHKNEKGGAIFQAENYLRDLEGKKISAVDELLENKSLEESKNNLKEELESLENKINDLEQGISLSKDFYRLQRIREWKKALEEGENTRKSLENLVNENKKSGFLPDEAYVSKLDSLISQKAMAEEEILSLNERIENCKKEKENILCKDNSTKALDGERKIILELQNQKNKYNTLSSILFASFIALCVIGIFLPPTFIAALPCIIASVVFLKKKKEIELDINNHEEAAENIVKNQQNDMAALRDVKSKEDTYLEMLSSKKALLDTISKSECELLEKWGDEHSSSVSIRDRARRFLHKYGELTAEYQRQKERASLITASDEKEDIDVLEKRVGSIASSPYGKNELPLKEGELEAKKIQKGQIIKEISALEGQLAIKRRNVPKLEELDYMISEVKTDLEEMNFKLSALKMAGEYLTEASRISRNKFAPALSSDASRIIGAVTDGKYNEVSMDSQTSISFISEDRTDSLSLLSDGTKSAVFLAFRACLALSLFNDPPPLVLDESLNYLDNRRMENTLLALSEISSRGLQVFIFTCTDREKRIVENWNNNTANILEIF